eukprot:m.125439 g.125439  ORF g.125439 m.125439 type:complete len:65 (-) comp13797_c0_seq1:178-372(-)
MPRLPRSVSPTKHAPANNINGNVYTDIVTPPTMARMVPIPIMMVKTGWRQQLPACSGRQSEINA